MAFFKRKTSVTNDIEISESYPDTFIGQGSSIKVGSSGNVQRGLFEAPNAEHPSYGDTD